MNARFLLPAACTAFFTSCVISHEARGPVEYDSRSFDRDAAKEVQVRLHMGAGDLKVSSGTAKLMQGYFTYNVPSWKPEVHYSSSGAIGELTIDQPGNSHGHFGASKYEWDIRFARDIPLDLTVNFGAGDAQLDLGSLSLKNVRVDMGVGKLQMDLRGVPKQDYNVQVNGGVGEATIRLPLDIGISADATGGIGSIHTHGLEKEDGHWINEAYRGSGAKIHLTVNGGIGTINLISE
jgi:hypothetical protein